MISFAQVGPLLPPGKLIMIPYRKPALSGGKVTGLIPVLDIQYGNVWTNIPKPLFDELHPALGDLIHLRIYHGDKLMDEQVAPYQRTFAEVPVGKPLVYINSLMNVAVALNLGSYAKVHKVESGLDWFIELSRQAASRTPPSQ